MMFEAFAPLLFWKRDRRKDDEPVDVERRRLTQKGAQDRLLESVDRLQQSVNRHCQK